MGGMDSSRTSSSLESLHDYGMDAVTELIQVMRREADTLEACGAAGYATLARRYAGLLGECLREWLDAEVTVTQAAALGNYTEDHIRTLIREGKLKATKRGSRIFIRRADVPTKPIRAETIEVQAAATEVAAQAPDELDQHVSEILGLRFPAD